MRELFFASIPNAIQPVTGGGARARIRTGGVDREIADFYEERRPELLGTMYRIEWDGNHAELFVPDREPA